MRRLMSLLLVAFGVWLLQAEAVTRDDFTMQTAQDLVDVCSVKPGEPNYEGALGFCYGFEEGAVQYYMTLAGSSPKDAYVCLPQPPPSRSDVIQWFLAWGRENSRYMTERPVDVFFRFLEATWPCRR